MSSEAVVDPKIKAAQEAYARYGAVTDYKNFQGNPMPTFEELPEKIQQAWVAAANPQDSANPVIATKQLRVDLDAIQQRVKHLPVSRPTSLVRTKLDEAIMWLGQNLKELGTPNPYPNSRDTSNTTVDPTADGLKF